MMADDSDADLLARAVRQHSAGQYAEAEAIYRELLGRHPQHVDALHLLGVLHGQTGRELEAVGLIKEAIARQPDLPAPYNNLGNVLRQMGRTPEAIAAFEKAVALNPVYAHAWSNLGNALRDEGQTAAATAAYRRAVELRPDVAEFHSNLGVSLREQGQVEEAVLAHRQAIALAPESADAYNNLGAALRDLGRAREALVAHERAVALRPDSLSALSNLGAALRKVGRTLEAIETLQRVLALNPRYADAHNNLGSALIDRGDFSAAVDSCKRALALRPDYADAHGNLAIALAYQGNVDEAMTHARHAVRLTPGQPLAHWNLSMLLLLVGDFELGWREHEWRWKCTSMMKKRQFAQPRWQGEALAGQTVLLFAEQGFGDMLQFVRFAPWVAQSGGRAVVECQPELFRLFEGMPGIAQLVRMGEPLPPFDLQCPLMSLPFALLGRPCAPPSVPYLLAGSGSGEDGRWGIDRSEFNVGLAWAGDPAHQNDRNRSIALEQLAPLASVGGVVFHSLQKGPAASELVRPPCDLRIVDHASDLTDFAETAALISQLDLVISVDTAVAHLAGAMGRATWLLLPFMPDWRWMLHRSESAWYPTMRIFRQNERPDWCGAIAAVVSTLKLEKERNGAEQP